MFGLNVLRAFVPIQLYSLVVVAVSAQAEALCRISVVDAENGWPVPGVELRTTHNVRRVSDNRGVIALDAPELMGRETWFTVVGHGYQVPADGFGQRGVRLTPRPNTKLTVKVHRQLPAKRLGRITGGGIFAESQRLGSDAGWREQGILGCDSVQTAVHNGRLFWAWGDTVVARYPLGLFHMTGATTPLAPLDRFQPPIKLRYTYFVDGNDRPRVIAKMPGDGPTWVSGLMSLPDSTGQKRLVGTYVKIEPPLTAYEMGLCVWDATDAKFKPYRVVWRKTETSLRPPPAPEGHPVCWTDSQGMTWALFGDPFPRVKCPATFEAWSDPQQWQTIEPQAVVPTRDGRRVTPHRGAICYSAYRKRWVCIFTQLHGRPSSLGEIWYAEAPQPVGPWTAAVKVVTHANYTFYNPHVHPEFTPHDSPILLFEGTYTRQFANNPPATPRFDYNQVLYRLDLDDPALVEE